MITLIGTSTTTIGFGLCGIEDMHEVWRDTPVERISQIVKGSKNPIIMIDEEIYRKAKDEIETDKILIVIPFRYRDEQGFARQEIDDVIKETVGITTTVEKKDR